MTTLYDAWKAAVEVVAATKTDDIKAAIGATGSTVYLPTNVPGEPVLPTVEHPTGQLWDADNVIKIMFEALTRLTPEISHSTGVPATTPGKAGDICIDDDPGGGLYIAKAAVGAGDWIKVN